MTERTEISNRKIFLEKLRVLGTCAVVLLHTVTVVKDNTADMFYWFPKEFRVFLGLLDLVTWCVPVFIMISGYLFLNPDRKVSFREMLGKYCRRILLALFLFGVPFSCLELVATQRTLEVSMIGRAFLMVFKGEVWAHMWYLYLIIFLYLITPALRWILEHIPVSSVYGVLTVLFVGSSLFPYLNKLLQTGSFPSLPDFGIYIFYYLCGYLFVRGDVERRSTPGREDREEASRILLMCLILLAAGMVTNRFTALEQVQMAYEYPFTVVFSLLLFALLRNREGKEGKEPNGLLRLREEVSRLSFAVYLIHPLFINIIYKFLGWNPLNYPLWIALPLFWLVILVLSLGASWVLHRIKPLRKYVL